MDKLVYLCYPALAVVLFWGAKVYGRKTWNDGFMSLKQTKALQGFFALLIMFHHIGQKTCASWLNPKFIIPGLELFVPIGYFFVGIFLFCSGYGVYKSFKTKPGYLDGFLGKRIVPLIIAYYASGIIFLIVRLLVGEKMDLPQFLYYLSGAQLANYYAWFVIALPFFYLAFYLSFKFCKKEGWAVFFNGLFLLVYVLIGLHVDHNNWWMKGEWWYNSVHFFFIGLLFAKFEGKIVPKIKRHYVIYLIVTIIALYFLYGFSEFAQAFFSYYGENMRVDDKVFRRMVCLLSQVGASWCFVFTVFLLTMKIKIGNKVLAFMGTITLEFYLIHGLFVELFGFNFLDVAPSVYYIKNVFLYTVVVIVCAIPSSLLFKKLINIRLSKKVNK